VTAQAILNGLLLGGVYAVAGLGLSLVFGVLRLVNLAHGELLVGGGYLGYALQRHLGLDPLLGMVFVIPTVFVIAYPIQRYLLNDLMGRNMEAPLVATFGVSLLAQSLFAKFFTSDSRSLSASYAAGGLHWAGLTIQVVDVIALGLAVVFVMGAHLALTRTIFGKSVRAAAEDPDTAGVMGINVPRIYALTFAAAAGITAAAGVVIGLSGALTPTGGARWLVIGFAVVVLGGVGSVPGTFVAAVALGLVQSVGGHLLGAAYGDLIVYATFFVALALRPTGLAGLRRP
jgi:branched-chain amino acid transport system permease protein